jgi:hypothetical protein
MHDQLQIDYAGVATPEPVTTGLGLFYGRNCFDAQNWG